MLSAITLVPLLAIGAVGQTTVQSIFFAAPSNTDAYVGSVVGVANDLTTYALACTSGDSGNCATSTTVTITEGPSTLAYVSETALSGVTGSASITCKISGTTSAACAATYSLSGNGESFTTTTSTLIGTDEFNYHPVTITAGANKLGSGGSGSSSSSSGNAGAPKATGIGMGVAGAAVLGLAAFL